MNKEKLTAWLAAFVLVICAPCSIRAQDLTDFDAAIIVKKSVWGNLASLLPAARITLPHGALSVVDAALCDIKKERVVYLVVLKETNALPTNLISETSCGKASGDITKDLPQTSYDIVAFLTVSSSAGQVQLSVTDSAARPRPIISDALTSDIRSYNAKIGEQTISLSEGAFSRQISVTVELQNTGMIVKGRGSGFSHPLHDPDIPKNFIDSGEPGNAKMVISHDAIGSLIDNYLKARPFPIKGTDAQAEIDSYLGDLARVVLQGKVTWHSLVFSASGTWSGGELRLSAYSVASLRDCSSGNAIQRGLCNAQREAETRTADAFAAGAWPKYQSSPLIPLNYDKKIAFNFYGKTLFLSGRTVGASSNPKGLAFSLDSYIGRQN